MRQIALHIGVAQMRVSIHAPREGCDKVVSVRYSLLEVSIHAPREGCDKLNDYKKGLNVMFQFTHPGRGATVWSKVAYYGADKQA